MADASERNLEYVAEYTAEHGAIAAARNHAADIGATPVAPTVGATLRLLATVIDARAVVEIGTGAGVSGTWLLQGMNPEGVLTSIDIEAENQRLAQETYTAAGFSRGRYRLITGKALEVLPRLADAAYDLVLIDANKADYPSYLLEALRLLRVGGLLAVDNSLWHDRVADPKNHDADTEQVRGLLGAVREDDRLTKVLLPIGDGLLVACKREADE